MHCKIYLYINNYIQPFNYPVVTSSRSFLEFNNIEKSILLKTNKKIIEIKSILLSLIHY